MFENTLTIRQCPISVHTKIHNVSGPVVVSDLSKIHHQLPYYQIQRKKRAAQKNRHIHLSKLTKSTVATFK